MGKNKWKRCNRVEYSVKGKGAWRLLSHKICKEKFLPTHFQCVVVQFAASFNIQFFMVGKIHLLLYLELREIVAKTGSNLAADEIITFRFLLQLVQLLILCCEHISLFSSRVYKVFSSNYQICNDIPCPAVTFFSDK